MTTGIFILVACVILLITVDTIKVFVRKRNPIVHSETYKRESERIVRVEAEVEAKMKEIERHQSERNLRHPSPPAASAPAASPPLDGERDPMNDTKCIAAVKEKADEIQRLGREKGI